MTVLVDGINSVANSWETLFTASVDTKIGGYAATNIAGNNVSYKAAISQGSTIREIINHQIIVRNKSHEGWQLVGQTIPQDWSLMFQTSEIAGVHFYVSD
jgi:hypothetical protein